MRVVVGDSHPIVRAGLRALTARKGCVIVGEAAETMELFARVKELAPDMVMLDLRLPAPPGVNAVAALRRDFPSLRLVVFASDAAAAARAMEIGVSACLATVASTEVIEEALGAVCEGRIFHHPPAPSFPVRIPGAPGTMTPLTGRQEEVLRLLAEGHSTKETAGLLGLSPKTVDVHRAHIMRKLKIHSVPGLVRYALRVGLIDANDGGN